MAIISCPNCSNSISSESTSCIHCGTNLESTQVISEPQITEKNESTNQSNFSNDFKNSTKEYEKDGINYNLLEFEVKFSKRSDKEAYALLKFLDDKAGFKIFDYTLSQPYNKTISVYCPEWNHTYEFKNNHSITAKFIQFKNPLKESTNFNTIITYTS